MSLKNLLLGFCKVAWGKFGSLNDLQILRSFCHIQRTVVLPFCLGTKGGDMKHQREVYKNTLVSIIHQHALKCMK